MRSIACKACFEFGDKTFEAFVTGRNTSGLGKKAFYNCLHSMQSTACVQQCKACSDCGPI
jgi:hypothetical protein